MRPILLLCLYLSGCLDTADIPEPYPWPILTLGKVLNIPQGPGTELIADLGIEVRKDASMPLSMFSVRFDLYRGETKIYREGDRENHLTMFWYGTWSPGTEFTRVVEPGGFDGADTLVARWSAMAYSDDSSFKCDVDSKWCNIQVQCLTPVVWCKIPDAYHRDPEYRDP